MILHPGSITLITNSFIILLLLSYASFLGIRILRNWDINSNSEKQFLLERQTYLVSSVVQHFLAFEIISLLIFIYTAEDIHNLLVGAMCATGSLNANPFGFPVLFTKIFLSFSAATWLAINYLDNKAEDYPLIRLKYKLIIILFIMIAAEFVLLIKYFINIRPDVITSCCGVLFNEGKGIKSAIDGLPLSPIVFYASLPVLVLSGLAAYKLSRRSFIYIFSSSSLLFLVISILSIISFISAYFYQMPTHNCPFCLFKREYYYAGYPLYATLFAGSFLGIIAGIAEPLKKIKSLSEIILQAQKKWILYGIICMTVFFIISSLAMILSPFRFV